MLTMTFDEPRLLAWASYYSGEYLCKVTQFHKVDSMKPKNAEVPRVCGLAAFDPFRAAPAILTKIIFNVFQSY